MESQRLTTITDSVVSVKLILKQLRVLKLLLWNFLLCLNQKSFQFDLDPFNRNTLFLFCGRRSDRIKALLWEGDGFLLMYKRLNKRSIQKDHPQRSDILHFSDQKISVFAIQSKKRRTLNRKCIPPYITPAKSHDYLACMGCGRML